MGEEVVARNDVAAEDEVLAADNEIYTEELGDGPDSGVAETKKQQ